MTKVGAQMKKKYYQPMWSFDFFRPNLAGPACGQYIAKWFWTVFGRLRIVEVAETLYNQNSGVSGHNTFYDPRGPFDFVT